MKSLSKINRKYGWKPSLPNRAKKYAACYAPKPGLPSSVDLRPKDVPIYDQGEIGSCVGNGTSGVVEFIQPSLGTPSRLFVYYNARIPEQDTDQDGGAQICDGVQGVVTYGVIPETEWPYTSNDVTVKPTPKCYADAKKDVVTSYFSLNDDQDIKQCLFAGFPVVFGMTVYESFESDTTASTGIVSMPADSEQQVGGHCMVIIGYDDTKQWWIVRNSWGTGWGDKGYCYIPYAYIDQFASDFWTVRADTDSALAPSTP